MRPRWKTSMHSAFQFGHQAIHPRAVFGGDLLVDVYPSNTKRNAARYRSKRRGRTTSQAQHAVAADPQHEPSVALFFASQGSRGLQLDGRAASTTSNRPSARRGDDAQ